MREQEEEEIEEEEEEEREEEEHEKAHDVRKLTRDSRRRMGLVERPPAAHQSGATISRPPRR